VIGDILGVPDPARRRILEFGELAAPSLDIGLTWAQYRRVNRGIEVQTAGSRITCRDHDETPGDDLMSQIIQASDEGAHLNDEELLATAGSGAGRRLRDDSQLAEQRDSAPARDA
jgi:cytochrome P450